ncbi:helix-turn-helix domain-containing protein [Agathobacter sp.]
MSDAVRKYAMQYAKEYGEEQKQVGIQAGIQAGIKQGADNMLYSLVQDGEIMPENAAKRLQITVSELERLMDEAGYHIPLGVL